MVYMTRVCKCVYVRGMCVCVCMCVCVVCERAHVRVSLWVFTCAFARACVYVRVASACARMPVFVHLCSHARDACKCGVSRVCAWAWVWVPVCRTKGVGSGNFDKSFVLAVNNRDIAYTFLFVAKVSENK